jgi:hypothetical protein
LHPPEPHQQTSLRGFTIRKKHSICYIILTISVAKEALIAADQLWHHHNSVVGSLTILEHAFMIFFLLILTLEHLYGSFFSIWMLSMLKNLRLLLPNRFS